MKDGRIVANATRRIEPEEPNDPFEFLQSFLLRVSDILLHVLYIFPTLVAWPVLAAISLPYIAIGRRDKSPPIFGIWNGQPNHKVLALL